MPYRADDASPSSFDDILTDFVSKEVREALGDEGRLSAIAAALAGNLGMVAAIIAKGDMAAARDGLATLIDAAADQASTYSEWAATVGTTARATS